MNEEQMTKFALDTTKNIAELSESTKSAHRRIDETDKLTKGIHELAKNVAGMSTEVRLLTKNMNSSIEKIEKGQKEQGVRIGGIEQAILTITRNEQAIKEHDKRLDKIEKAPADKWNKLTWLVIAGVVTAVVAFLMGNLL